MSIHLPSPTRNSAPGLILGKSKLRGRSTLTWAYLSVLLLSSWQSATALATEPVRFATFNVSLYGSSAGELKDRLASGNDKQCAVIAEIIQRSRPDIILLNEFDYEPGGKRIALFQQNYLQKAQNVSDSETGPAEPIEFAYGYAAPANTGVHSGFDLDRNGRISNEAGSADFAGDCWGFGRYPGQYGMVVLSKFPIAEDQIRTFQHFKWKDMPGALLPGNPEAEGDWYSQEALESFPLSSKSHWDIPIRVRGKTIHVLASHPTPPVYDGPEDRNGRRNHDEIRFWADYIQGGQQADYIYDDQDGKGGLATGSLFVIMGDLNSDPHDGDGSDGIRLLLSSPKLARSDPPQSEGGKEQSSLQGGANAMHQGNPTEDTLDAADDPGPGNLRLDYVLPARGMRCVASSVFWPNNNDRLFTLVGTHPFPGSDHRLVWVDIDRD